ncbi:hypothetical protein D3C72_2293400 [compost metagenome]
MVDVLVADVPVVPGEIRQEVFGEEVIDLYVQDVRRPVPELASVHPVIPRVTPHHLRNRAVVHLILNQLHFLGAVGD